MFCLNVFSLGSHCSVTKFWVLVENFEIGKPAMKGQLVGRRMIDHLLVKGPEIELRPLNRPFKGYNYAYSFRIFPHTRDWMDFRQFGECIGLVGEYRHDPQCEICFYAVVGRGNESRFRSQWWEGAQ